MLHMMRYMTTIIWSIFMSVMLCDILVDNHTSLQHYRVKKEVSGVETTAVREKTPDGARGAKESPTPPPKKPKTKTPPPSPRSSVSVKEAK